MPGKVLQPVLVICAHKKSARSLGSNYIKLLLYNASRCDKKRTTYDIIITLRLASDKLDGKKGGIYGYCQL
jgi:hypothetical protein